MSTVWKGRSFIPLHKAYSLHEKEKEMEKKSFHI